MNTIEDTRYSLQHTWLEI